jgi:hypothetical protein
MLGIIASISSAITSAVSSIGPAVSSFCANVLPRIAPILKQGLEILSTVCRIAEILMHVFNVFKPEDTVEDIGDRAIQASEKESITPDKFDDFDDYMEAIRNFELDPQRSAEISHEAKIVAGLAIGSKGLDEKLFVNDGTMANLWVLAASNPDYFNAERLEAILGKTVDITSIMQYFEGKLGPADTLETEKNLVDVEKSISPNKDEKTIYSELDAASRAVQELSRE